MAQMPLQNELQTVLNYHSRESMSDTPDFILAQYIMDCLAAFERATQRRDAWYRDEPIPLADTKPAGRE